MNKVTVLKTLFVRGLNPAELDERVNAHLKEGWQLHGEQRCMAFADTLYWIQTIVQREE